MLFCVVGSIAAAQSIATVRDSAAWDAVTNTSSYSIVGYDVVLSTTNTTVAQLGNTNGVPVIAGVLAKTRATPATMTTAALSSFVTNAPTYGNYTLWARTAATLSGATNLVVSDWTNIPVTWVNLPPPPANLRVQ